MERIWAPWRMKYIEMKKPEDCFLCILPKDTDDVANYILYRGQWNFVIMNSYPYNPGHLLVAPSRHIANLEELTGEEIQEHLSVVSQGIKVLKQVLNPSGFNIGMNIGRIAGAGIDTHLHSHIVPRWLGDTNFMTVTSDVRVLPEALAETYEKLKDKF
ncbi:HIT domain-containing protein [Chloroflexota bacterium]